MKKLLLAAEQRKVSAWQCQEENWKLGWDKWETALRALRFIANISFLFLIIQHWDEPHPHNVFRARGQLVYFHLNQKHDPGLCTWVTEVMEFWMLHQLSSKETQSGAYCIAVSFSLQLDVLIYVSSSAPSVKNETCKKKSRDVCWRACTPLDGENRLVLILGDGALCNRGQVSTFSQKVSPTG